MKVLIAEDDRLIRQGLTEVFQIEGFEVLEAYDGQMALDLFRKHVPNVVCLDIMMPRLNGYDACRAIRQLSATVPVLFITARSEEVDKVLGLELGADDFIVKPFGVKEVMARVRAIVRRCQAAERTEQESFWMDDLEIFPKALRARRETSHIDLSPRDIQLLRVLYDRAGEAVDRLTLFQWVWGAKSLPNSRTLDQHISQLRKRIERDPAEPRIVKTVHGVGYRYETPLPASTDCRS